ncbi:hypothetical protein CP985_10345 [Malaciobacter mytili LMG 24559]|uniref:Uncharacterized protein n=1 Tax=Malaciobacter mytili LMG 24559 TaxID=1032238 RepID=A0AAX2AEM8_9BACT|nr:hypothetical protein [Malaciobacter mytili]AXH16435.1 hypothetical protein AMYT_a0137 [Malaciobacter mytili LMG 24559]RXK15095.1 hypothetical protein CP985_10345 [Malaciobacter mytili LMG 24559]
MKKIFISSIIAATFLFAAQSNAPKDINIESNYKSTLYDYSKMKNEDIKSFLYKLESTNSFFAEQLRDYTVVKTCNDEFYNNITLDELIQIANSNSITFFTALKYLNKEKPTMEENKYLQILNNYRFINCGVGSYYTDKPYMDLVK